jgi:flagella basal body P-ring formation protein FlgA
MVKVQVICGDLTVIGSGISIGDGQMGQLIRLRNPDSRREFSARVIGEGLVEVRLED